MAPSPRVRRGDATSSRNLRHRAPPRTSTRQRALHLQRHNLPRGRPARRPPPRSSHSRSPSRPTSSASPTWNASSAALCSHRRRASTGLVSCAAPSTSTSSNARLAKASASSASSTTNPSPATSSTSSPFRAPRRAPEPATQPWNVAYRNPERFGCEDVSAQCFPRKRAPLRWGNVTGSLFGDVGMGKPQMGCPALITAACGCPPGGACTRVHPRPVIRPAWSPLLPASRVYRAQSTRAARVASSCRGRAPQAERAGAEQDWLGNRWVRPVRFERTTFGFEGSTERREKHHEDPQDGSVRFGDCRTRAADPTGSPSDGEKDVMKMDAVTFLLEDVAVAGPCLG